MRRPSLRILSDRGSKNLQSLLGQLADRAFLIGSSVITTLLAIIGIASASSSFQVLGISLTFCLTIVLMLYIIIHISAVTTASIRHHVKTSKRTEILSARYTELRIEHERYVSSIGKSDQAFKNIGLSRILLDDVVFKCLVENDSPEKKRETVEDAIRGFLVSICDAAVDIFASRKHAERDYFSASIKIIEKKRGKYTYSTIARSSNIGNSSRDHDDDNPYLLSSNASYYHVMENIHRRHVIPDLKSFIRQYKKLNMGFIAPTEMALEYYEKSLTVAVYLKSRSQKKLVPGHRSENAYRSRLNDLVYGFISIDSKAIKVGHGESDILLELSFHVLSALRFHDFIDKMIDNSESIGEEPNS